MTPDTKPSVALSRIAQEDKKEADREARAQLWNVLRLLLVGTALATIIAVFSIPLLLFSSFSPSFLFAFSPAQKASSLLRFSFSIFVSSSRARCAISTIFMFPTTASVKSLAKTCSEHPLCAGQNAS
jgi:hypothetical protein